MGFFALFPAPTVELLSVCSVIYFLCSVIYVETSWQQTTEATAVNAFVLQNCVFTVITQFKQISE